MLLPLRVLMVVLLMVVLRLMVVLLLKVMVVLAPRVSGMAPVPRRLVWSRPWLLPPLPIPLLLLLLLRGWRPPAFNCWPVKQRRPVISTLHPRRLRRCRRHAVRAAVRRRSAP